MKTLQDYIDKLNKLNFKEMYEVCLSEWKQIYITVQQCAITEDY